MESNEKKLMGYRIKELRRCKGLSQEELAERAETSPNYVSRMERGTENPTFDTLIKIANALEIEMWELFDFGHRMTLRDIRELMNKFVDGADEEKLRLAVKVFRSILR
ncbi:MAG: helix-turn-helix transcriptional regulator [Deltaproteobacteria bacterium]|nr:helix-turn-helix transcriptional regulator [Deltaproteobacteria bacterium]